MKRNWSKIKKVDEREYHRLCPGGLAWPKRLLGILVLGHKAKDRGSKSRPGLQNLLQIYRVLN